MIEFEGFEAIRRPQPYLLGAAGCAALFILAALIDRDPLMQMSWKLGLLFLVIGLAAIVLEGFRGSSSHAYRSDLEEAEEREWKRFE